MADLDPTKSGDLDRAIANALAARRTAPTRAFRDRLHAAVERPPRPGWLVPIALGACVAAAAVVVLVMRVDRPDRDDDRETPVVVAPAGGGSNHAAPPAPVPPASPDVGDLLAPYQRVLDGDARGLALDDKQLVKLRDISDDLGVKRAQLTAQREIALIELRRALQGTDAERARAPAILDRVTAADAALRRAELGAKLAARDVLDSKQRAQLDRRADPVAATGKLTVASSPAKARVLIDGVVVGMTPVDVTLAIGKHDVALELDGYQGSKSSVDLRGSGQMLDVILVRKPTPPPATAGTLQVKTSPAGARVTIDGRIVGTAPLVLQLAPGTHRVHIAKDGVTARDVTVEITAGETQVVRAVLERDSATDMGLKNPFADDDRDGISDPFASSRSPAATGNGTLRVQSRPFSTVFVDGKQVGTTPLIMKLAPGVHRVTLVRDTQKTTRTVKIESGKTQAVIIDFDGME